VTERNGIFGFEPSVDATSWCKSIIPLVYFSEAKLEKWASVVGILPL
jgi:hypothetical protein